MIPSGAPTEAHLDEDLPLAVQGHILQEEARHALAITIQSLGILPELGKVRSQSEDLGFRAGKPRLAKPKSPQNGENASSFGLLENHEFGGFGNRLLREVSDLQKFPEKVAGKPGQDVRQEVWASN